MTGNKLEAVLKAGPMPEQINPDHPACLTEALAKAGESSLKKGVHI
jgi:hypothetical protein